MKSTEEFEHLTENLCSNPNGESFRRKSVIKKHAVKYYPPKKIEINESDFEENDSPRVEPIIEDNNIIGVVHKCSCGKVIEIRFEYANE